MSNSNVTENSPETNFYPSRDFDRLTALGYVSRAMAHSWRAHCLTQAEIAEAGDVVGLFEWCEDTRDQARELRHMADTLTTMASSIDSACDALESRVTSAAIALNRGYEGEA